MLTEEAARILFQVFVQRKDTYTTQNENGTYQRIAQEITEADIVEHLNGNKTIGLYQFSQESKLRWIVYDFDGTNLDEQKELAKQFYQKLLQNKAFPVPEFSGKKGYHLWVFCNETDGASAKYWAEQAANGCSVHEIFPKQETVEGFGNCVKLPMGVHQASKKRSCLLNENFEELSPEKAIAMLQAAYENRITIPTVIIREIIRTITKPQTKQAMPSYIQYLISKGAVAGKRHESVFVITKELYNNGFPKEEILEQCLLFNQNCKEPKPEYIINTHVSYLLQYPEKYLAQETIEDISYAELKDIERIDYGKVIATYKKWFYMKNEDAIDIALATAISRKEKMQPLWIIMVAPSGSGKSELIRPFADDKQPSTTEIMSKITPNTFLSGISSEKTPHIDFAETLENTPKLFITYDFAQFIKLDSEQKGQIWAQLRDLYDGFMERKAFNVHKKVENIKVNWLICTTPIIDSELLIQQELGTRELVYRFDSEEIEKKDLMKTIWENSEKLDAMRKELKSVVRAFIEKKESEGMKRAEISPEARTELETLALTISILRAATESDNYTGELTNFVYEEMPTRILLQLKDLFTTLKSLDETYSDEKALKILRNIASSSIHPIRLQIILELIQSAPLTTTAIQKRLSIGWKTVLTQLYTAKQLGLVDFVEIDETEEGAYRNWKKKSWFLTTHEVNDYIKAKMAKSPQ